MGRGGAPGIRMKHTAREDAALAGSLVDAAPIGIYVLDSGLRVLHANDTARRVFGRFAAGLVGRELGPVLAGLWGADAAAMSIDAFRTPLETGRPFASEEFSARRLDTGRPRSEEHTSELQSLTRI